MVYRKINRTCQMLFKHCKIDLPDRKVLHLGRKVGMNYAKDNGVGAEDMFCMTGHATGDKMSNIAKDHYFMHSPPAAMHVMSGATEKKEWTLSRASCLTYEFESCVHSKHSEWLEQVNSVNGDKTIAASNFLNVVLRNDQRVITQDGKL